MNREETNLLIEDSVSVLFGGKSNNIWQDIVLGEVTMCATKQIEQQFRVKSHSDGRRHYKVTLTKDDKWECSCPAWIYKNPRVDCKHIEEVKVKL